MPSWGLDFIRGMWSSCGSPFGHPDPGVGVPSSGLQPSQLVGCSTKCWESARSLCVTASSVVPTSLAWHIAGSFIPPCLPSLRLSNIALRFCQPCLLYNTSECMLFLVFIFYW